ncbi:MAG: efflux RND transporter periplasmic adaptor subunit [Rhizobiaceae bacterium]|nr:efflux RND transporter periplasmic adaptor subunit [Rhizobiaceae bacterium]
MIKRFLIAFVLLAIVCGGIVYFNIFRDQAIQAYFANMPRPSLAVSTEKVVPVTWTPGIEAIGTVNARSGVDLTVETTGVVHDIMFRANEKVARDQVLVQMDDAVQRADLEAAKAQAALDKQALDRALELQRKGVGSSVNVESASAAATTSAANVAKLQAVLDQKQLKAPFGGTMGIPKIDDGQYLAPGTLVATLQDMDTMRADFTVPEQELAKLSIGQAVRLGVDQANWPFTGEITGIDPKVDPATRLVSVRAEVANPENRLSPGQFVQVRVQLPQESGVIAVLQTAVVTSLYGDYVYVVVADDAKPAAAPAPAEGQAAAADAAAPAQPAAPALVAKQVFVKIGRQSDGRVEIVSGVAADDIVVTSGQNRLSNGAPVTINNDVTPDKQAAAQ